ncbi:MAG: MotA/TolQ/ExbB proton channel family protein [Polyangiaceae bacterium]|nr:MotA/TolQ/ExbB proton channel family protein [Polyangiaceae bacterium]
MGDPTTVSVAVEPTLNPVKLILGASGIELAVFALLAVASTAVWIIWFLKSTQLRAMAAAQHRFERAASEIENASDLVQLALDHRNSPGARVVIELARRYQQSTPTSELLLAVAKRAIANEQQRASSLMPTLSSIASASPFIGLFGTVWGIMDAFMRIGAQKSASLPVVAPAIGIALIATAAGLVAAIPATIGFNYVDARIGNLLDELNASAETWVETLMNDARATGAAPTTRQG